MNRPLLLQDYLQAIPPRKRRYSSTAVGFPIRYDLSAHSQGISSHFPSGVRARCACTYVCPHAMSDNQAKERPLHTLPTLCIILASATLTPSAVLILFSLAACLLLGLAVRKPIQQSGISRLATHDASPFRSWFTCSSLGNYLKSCTVYPPSVLHTFSQRSVHVQTTFSPRSVHVPGSFRVIRIL